MTALYDYKIEVFIPGEFVERLLDELSKLDVGHIGNYDHCASVTNVKGFWRPLEGANPFDGKLGTISKGDESKVEVNCRKENARDALRVIRDVHPYDEPVINIIPLSNDLFEDGD
jgi:hypothetical protein